MKKLLLFLAIIFSTHSHALEFQGKFLQGYFILGKAETGSKVFVEDGGYFLNNEMDDFSIKPGFANMFGLIGSDANSIKP